jgi:lysozyme
LAATAFVSRHEGLRLESYLDPAGVWTVGYGHTGPGVHAGLRITQAQADDYLRRDLALAAAKLAAVVNAETVENLTDNQYAALLSFVFNLGAHPKWTIWRRLNAGQYEQVPAEIGRFVYVSTPRGKSKLQGLVNRRAAEVVLWSTDEPGSLDEHPPSSVTREVWTPPVASNPLPLAKEPVFALTVGGVILGAPALIAKAVEALTPYAQQSHQVRSAIEVLSALGPIAAGLAALFLFLQKQQASR